MACLGQWRTTGIRHLLLRNVFPGNVYCQTRASSLSAIHRGVRRSQRVDHEDDFRQRNSSDRDRRSRLTSKAIDGISSPRQQLSKLRKKLHNKAEEEEEEKESTRQTRRKRFLDPEKSFGKKSLVYQLKHGELRREILSSKLRPFERPAPFRSLETEKRPQPGRSRRERPNIPERVTRTERFFEQERPARSGSIGRSKGFVDRDWPPRQEQSDRQEQPIGRERAPRLEQSLRQGRSINSEKFAKFRTSLRPTRNNDTSDPKSYRPRSDDQEHDEDQEDDFGRGRKRALIPTTIKFTTAASQFLYGRSVVKAALEQSRRKLYNLYIYAGENRKDTKDNDIIASAAERLGVPVTMIPKGEQSTMDKMSMGRPHNGFILEASPLPQLPITSLDRLEESLGKLGFHVELDYQSREEEAINGRDTFVSRKNDIAPKPFVLLLHEILDPGNLGGLLRTASYCGVDAVVITNRSSSTLTPVVLKSAAGAAEEVTIFTVDSPVEFIERSKEAGWKTYAAVAPPKSKLAKMHQGKFISTDTVEQQNPLSTNPCILILGNEGHGLSKPMKLAADYELSIPRFVQHSCVDSLNVSVAAGLLCHAFVKTPDLNHKAADAMSRDMLSRRIDMDKGFNEAQKEDQLF